MYKVQILPKAEEDICANTDYIAFAKKAPETALQLARGFYKTIAKLESMPEAHALDDDKELAIKGIRKCYYRRYKIYFYIDESAKKVYVLRVLHMLVDAKPKLILENPIQPYSGSLSDSFNPSGSLIPQTVPFS